MTIERNLLAAPSEPHQKVEIYSGVARLARTVWGSEVRPSGSAPTTALVLCHPTANFLGHYALPGLAERGFGAVGLTTRYVGNDTSLIMESCLEDMGAMVEHLYDRGYDKVVLVGNSGGASIVPYYQAQAQLGSIVPGLRPVDGIVLLNAHPSRARLITEWIDPAITDEHLPFERDASLDMYDPANGPPYAEGFVERYRAAQVARNRRITQWAIAERTALLDRGIPGLEDLAFVVQGTAADLRFLDGTIDPSDREVGVTLWGPPEVANHMPAGITRVTTLRAWVNQWSIDHTNADSLRWLPDIDVPVCVVLGTADPTVMPAMAQEMHDAATRAPVRHLEMIPGATHYFEGQPDLLTHALDTIAAFVDAHVSCRVR